jgi:aminoglycoside phosphotransferase (APT) family kinase protein
VSTDATDDVAEQLEAVLGGRVASLRRLSGGASRITSAFDLETQTGKPRPLILQQLRGAGPVHHPGIDTEAGLLRAAGGAGVPVPEVVASGAADGLPPGWLVVERLEGESIPRRILRDEEFAAALPTLNDQTARALAAIHSIDPASVPGLPRQDPLGRPLDFLDALHQVRPILELGARWLALGHPPREGAVLLHGDFRMGNFLVDTTGLRAVLDWELAHLGDPAEDIGWLCARSWRFGGPGRVGGFGDLDGFLAAYTAASGRTVDRDGIRWWEAYATVKWAVVCLLQAAAHLSGATPSVELAAIGRRVCESEWDLLVLMGVAMPGVPETLSGNDPAKAGEAASSGASPLFGRPSKTELVEAVRHYLDKVIASAEGAARFEARVAHNVLSMVGREMDMGQELQAAHHQRLLALGFPDDSAVAQAIRAGRYDQDLGGLGAVLAEDTRDQLLVSHPSYLDEFL